MQRWETKYFKCLNNYFILRFPVNSLLCKAGIRDAACFPHRTNTQGVAGQKRAADGRTGMRLRALKLHIYMRTAQCDVVFLVEATHTKTSAKSHQTEVWCRLWAQMMFFKVLFCRVAAVWLVSAKRANSVFAFGTYKFHSTGVFVWDLCCGFTCVVCICQTLLIQPVSGKIKFSLQ